MRVSNRERTVFYVNDDHRNENEKKPNKEKNEKENFHEKKREKFLFSIVRRINVQR